MPANPILGLLGGLGQGLAEGQKQKRDAEYKKALTDHIKTQAKLDQQKIDLMAMQGQLEGNKFDIFKQMMSGGVSPSADQMVPKNPKALMPQSGGGQIQPQSFNQSQQLNSINPKFGDLINQVASEQGVDPKLLASVITHESNFDPTATSPKGAMGLMQLMPETASQLGVKDPYDPVQNVTGGAKYLKSLLTQFNGDIPKTIAAYNAGPGRVEQGQLPEETKMFVPKVMATYQSLQQPQQGKNNMYQGMSEDFINRFQAMNAAYKSQTGKDINVTDAFRTNAQQAEVYRNKPNLAAPPGYSNHEKGMAMDINTTQANELAQMGLLDKFGFTRPMLGQGSSGKNEPWHIELNPSVIQNQGQPNIVSAQYSPQQGQANQSPQGQMQQPGQPMTAPGGRPILSDRDRFSIALQYFGGVKLPDRKNPLKYDVGDRIMVADPDNPESILAVIPKTPDTITVTKTDEKGQKWNEYYTQPRPGQPAQALGRIQVEPGAYQQGLLKGMTATGELITGPSGKELGEKEGQAAKAKNEVAGMPIDQATKRQLAQSGINDLQTAKGLIFTKDGKIDTTNLVNADIGTPFTQGRNLESLIFTSIDSVLRAASGATINMNEWPRYKKMYVPSSLDDSKTAREKVVRLETFLSGLLEKIEPGYMNKVNLQPTPELNTSKQAPQTSGGINSGKILKYNPQTGMVE
jgi:hypothetical protein